MKHSFSYERNDDLFSYERNEVASANETSLVYQNGYRILHSLFESNFYLVNSITRHAKHYYLSFRGKKRERIWFNLCTPQFELSELSLLKFNTVVNRMLDLSWEVTMAMQAENTCLPIIKLISSLALFFIKKKREVQKTPFFFLIFCKLKKKLMLSKVEIYPFF